ncbi:MAG: LysR family transcriptional regulator [Paenibacillus sp.]|nr:LysR family transcriptional regulator [Paenibacillus sp.]
MNYLSLRYFLEVARCLSYSQAAQRLHISQPGLSQQMKALEQELGISLLNRSARKVSLTEEGAYLFEHLLPSFETIDKTVLSLQRTGAVPKTTIRIATVPSAASNHVPYLIKSLKTRYPDMDFYIKETTSVHAIELVQNGEYHLAFIRTPVDIDQSLIKPLHWMEFQKYPLQLAVSDSHPSRQDPVNLYDFRNETFLHYDPVHSPSLYYLLEHACLTAGFIPNTIGSGPEILTIANLISSGIGITIMPQDMLQLMHSHGIIGLNLKNQQLYSSISAIWNETNVSAITREALRALELFQHS